MERSIQAKRGTPQGGSVSVLLEYDIYLHYAFSICGSEKVVKPRLRGEACMVRYIDDFVLCFPIPFRCPSRSRSACKEG